MLLCMILKVIGLVLLFLLLLLLLLLGLVLLVPIRYAGAGHKGEEATDYAAHIELSWLLRMAQLHADITPAGLAYSLRILCFHPGNRRKPDMPAANVSDEASSRSEEATADATVADGSDEAPSENKAVPSPDDTAADASDGFKLPDEYTDVELKQPPKDEKIPEESVNVPESKAEASERAAAQTAEVDSIERLMAAVGLETRCRAMDQEEILQATRKDKKMDHGHVRFILLRQLGEAYIDLAVSDAQMLEGLRSIMQTD